MRETPSGGVGSIQDQGVNYIQLNTQPSMPLLNTQLRNATLNKDHERWTSLDPAQLPAREGQPWPPLRTRRSGGGRWGPVEDQNQPRTGQDGWERLRCPSFSSIATTHCRAGHGEPTRSPPGSTPTPPTPHPTRPSGPRELGAGAAWAGR